VVRFVSTSDGRLISEEQIPITEGLTVDSFSAARPNTGIVVLSLSNGQALVVQHQYTVAFPNNVRVIRPSIYFPLGKELMTLNMAGLPLLHIGIQEEGAIR
jgi:phosphate transport system permease protein